MSKGHTPGPWFVVEGSDAKCDAVCHDEDAAFPLAYVGTERTLREKHANAKLIAAAPDHALLLAAFAKGTIRWEPFFPTQDGTKGELAINGMRYVTSLDEFGCPALNEVLRAALTGRRPKP